MWGKTLSKFAYLSENRGLVNKNAVTASEMTIFYYKILAISNALKPIMILDI